MLVTTKIKIDLQRPSYPVVVNAVQGDQNTRQLEISLFSGSVAWMVPDNVAVAMRYCKPDNTNGYYDTMPDGTASFAVSENTVSVLLAPQMLTVPGTVVAQVVLYLGTQTLATFAIYIRVEADPSAGAVTSEDYVNWAQWIKSELDAYLEKLKTNGEFVGGTFVGDVNMNGHALSGLREPVAPDDAATKEYVDKNASTGAVSSVAGVAPDENGNVPLDAASVKALPLGGGTMEGPINMNGQKLTGLNEPTQDDEAANKGYVDEQKAAAVVEANVYTIAEVKAARPRNLLDNSDFTNPVNQRGFVSGVPSGDNAYFIDRWQTVQNTTQNIEIEMLDSGLIIHVSTGVAGITQRIIVPKTDVTIAAKVNGKIVFAHAKQGEDVDIVAEGEVIIYVKWYEDIFQIAIQNEQEGAATFAVEWIALYEGEYTAETLPVYQPKGYGAELAECQRYFYKGRLYARKTADLPTYPVTNFQYPVTMRINPTLSFGNVLAYSNDGDLGLTALTHERNKADGVYTLVLSGTPSVNDMTIFFEASADL